MPQLRRLLQPAAPPFHLRRLQRLVQRRLQIPAPSNLRRLQQDKLQRPTSLLLDLLGLLLDLLDWATCLLGLLLEDYLHYQTMH